MERFKSLSFNTVFLLALFISIFRLYDVNKKEISWDVLGYYMYLPATFIHNDPYLSDITWFQNTVNEKDLAGTMYMVSSNAEGKPMYFFLMGNAISYSPGFFIAHLYSKLFGYEQDGFSLPYQYGLVCGGVFYAIVGIYFLRKILKRYFSERLTAILLILLVFGTNYLNHNIIKNLETVNVLFMLACIVIWYTIRWHECPKKSYLMFIGLSVVLIALVKPSEIFIVFFPLLYQISNIETFKQKMFLLWKHRLEFIPVLLVGFLLAVPQLFYWYHMTGHIFYDSYKNPGVGLDIFSPHIFESLFSYRKGWLLYTPLMVFALCGIPIVFKKHKELFWAAFTYGICVFYVVASWSEWWYGAAFSNRPLIILYPLLLICLGYFIQVVWRLKGFVVRGLLVVSLVFFVFLNVFQFWQMRVGILDLYRTTKAFYWAIFLNTKYNPSYEKLKLVERDFFKASEFSNKDDYQLVLCYHSSFLPKDSTIMIADGQEFLDIEHKPYGVLTKKDHIWIEVQMEVKQAEIDTNNIPLLTYTIERKEGTYGYLTKDIKEISSTWRKYTFEFLSPEIRSQEDLVKIYIWNRQKKSIDVRNACVRVFERKE